MSQKLNLVLYPSSDGRLNERGCQLVDSVGIPDSFLEILADEFGLVETNIFMNPDSQNSFPIEHFDNNDISKIITKLENVYKDLLVKEAMKFCDKDLEVKYSDSLNLEIYEGNDSGVNTVKISIKTMQVFLAVVGLFAIKNEQYAHNDCAFIKVG